MMPDGASIDTPYLYAVLIVFNDNDLELQLFASSHRPEGGKRSVSIQVTAEIKTSSAKYSLRGELRVSHQ